MGAQHIPAALPEKPEGWTKRMSMHLNFGSAGGSACYQIHDAEGRDTGIVYQYDTRKPTPAIAAAGKRKAQAALIPAPTGFHVPAADTDVFPNWAALRAAWPQITEKLKARTDGSPA